MKMTFGGSQKDSEGGALYQYAAVFSVTLNIITSGMHYGWPSPSLPILLEKTNDTSKLTITTDEGSWIAIMPLAGAVIGSLITGTIVDYVGRKKIILINCIPYFLTWIMVAFSKSSVVLCIARFIAGACDGSVFTAAPMYIGEIASPKIRGFLCASVSLTWTFGILLVNVIGAYVSIQVTALICSVIPIMCLLTFVWMPESPYQLVLKNKEEKAIKSLQILRGTENVSTELERIKKGIAAKPKTKGSCLDLVRVKSNRKALYVMLGVRTGQQLSGITAITFYTQYIFNESGAALAPKVATIIFFSVQLIIATCSSSIVDKAGRRPLLILSSIGVSLCLVLEGTYFYIKAQTSIDVTSLSYIPVIALVSFIVTYGIGLNSIPLLLLGELFPTSVKAFALCTADIYFSILASVISKFFQIVDDTYGMYLPFYAFSALSLFSLLFTIFFVPETKGKTLEEIQDYFEYKTSKRSNKPVV